MPVAVPRKLTACTLLVAALTSLCLGCGQSGTESKSDVLAQLDPQFVEQHGQLYFVNDVKAGCQLAAERGMPCLFFFTAEWCTFCHRMADTAFSDTRVGQLGQNFVCVIVDADRDADMCRYFAITGFPTVEFVSPQGHSLHRLVGQQSPSDLAMGMQAALGRFAWMSDSQLR
jgi:thiol:disulfide interchange protein